MVITYSGKDGVESVTIRQSTTVSFEKIGKRWYTVFIERGRTAKGETGRRSVPVKHIIEIKGGTMKIT